MSTVLDVVTAIEAVAVEVLDAAGLDELGKLLNAATKLAEDVAAAIKAKQPNLKAEVEAADLTADVVEDEKFGSKG